MIYICMCVSPYLIKVAIPQRSCQDISAPPAQELMKQNSAQMISNGAVPSSASPNVATSGESTKRKGHQPTSAPPPTPAMGILYSPFTSSSQWQSHTVALPSGQDEPHGLGPVEAHEVIGKMCMCSCVITSSQLLLVY